MGVPNSTSLAPQQGLNSLSYWPESEGTVKK